MFEKFRKLGESCGVLVPEKPEQSTSAQPAPAVTPVTAPMQLTTAASVSGEVNEGVHQYLHNVLNNPTRASKDYLSFLEGLERMKAVFPGQELAQYKGAMGAASLNPLMLETAMVHQFGLLDEEERAYSSTEIPRGNEEVVRQQAEIDQIVARIAEMSKAVEDLIAKKIEADTALDNTKNTFASQHATFATTLTKVRADLNIERTRITQYCGVPVAKPTGGAQ